MSAFDGATSEERFFGTCSSPVDTPMVVKKGIFAKKGMGSYIRPWSLRTVMYTSDNVLSYYEGNRN